MNAFPATDPIPLPAPIWLFKVLHVVTLSLHFAAMEILLGGVLIAVALSLGTTPAQRGAAAAMARRLTVVMTYVINFGVPPLLFAQVLYGRALYTSSVLIGAWWIAVIPILVACYWMLYRFAERAETGKSAWIPGLIAWGLAAVVSKIFSVNMALMLRPEDWPALYAASAGGWSFPTQDPTLMPRFLFLFAGGFAVAGCWMIWIGTRSIVAADVRSVLLGAGGWLATVLLAVQMGLILRVLSLQPAMVQQGIAASTLWNTAKLAWFATAAVTLALAAYAAIRRPQAPLYGALISLVSFLSIAAFTLLRDGIRDLTLLSKGFDVWDRVVVTNWSVVGIFLVTFVLGLGAVGWLISVFLRARRQPETALA